MRYAFLPVLFFWSVVAFAQTGKVRGFVYDEETDEPIAFANAVLKGTTKGAVANEDGLFVINNVEPGSYVLQVTFIGYAPYEKDIAVVAGIISNEKIYLKQSSEILKDVEINVDRQARETKVLTSVISIDPKDIQQFSVGGDADIIKAIQVLPGVITTGDQGGQLYIRGGAPIQNLVLLDGMVIYNPFHSIGFFSVFDADIIRTADVYTGGFNAEYGSRNSSVMDIKTRDGNRKRFTGKLGMSTYTSKILLETPLGARDKNGFASTSFLVSAKTSYLDQTSQIFYPYVETEYGGLPFEFNDIYAKLALQSDNGSRVAVFGFSFDDAVRFGGNNSIDWDSRGMGMNFTAVPPTSAVLISGDLAYSIYDITSVSANSNNGTSSISGFNGGLDFTYFLRENDEFKYGVEAIGYRTEYEFTNDLGISRSQIENTTELGGYMRYKYAGNRLLIEPSLRVHYYSSQSELSIEPRFGIKYNVTNYLRFKASGGLFSQNLIAANSDRDVVNLFYGFLSGPSNIPDTFEGEEVTSRLQKARHIIIGGEVEVTDEISVNIEAYIKDFNQLTNVNRNQLYEEGTNLDKPEVLRSEFIIERGFAQGIDILGKYTTKSTNIWLAYSIGKITRNDGIEEYAPFFDRRHNLNLVTNYSFGKELSWEFSMRYNFGTGFPFTPTQAFFSEQSFLSAGGQIDVAYDYTSENGELGVLYGDFNSNRLPNYHRVDVSITKNYKMKNQQEMEISAGATNVLNYQNIFYYDRIENRRVDQLPIMPTVSINYMF